MGDWFASLRNPQEFVKPRISCVLVNTVSGRFGLDSFSNKVCQPGQVRSLLTERSGKRKRMQLFRTDLFASDLLEQPGAREIPIIIKG